MRLKASLIILSLISIFTSCELKTSYYSNLLITPWEEVAEIPSSLGDMSKGVSAAYAGVLDGSLLVAGGCNFPDVPAAMGGEKVFYKDVLLLKDGEWKIIGELPEALAYGVSVKYNDKLYFIGGQNSKSVSSFYQLSLDEGLEINRLTPLPVNFDNGSGVLLGSTIYIIGGNQNGKPSSDVWSFDLANEESTWMKRESIPIKNGLLQSIAVAGDNELFVFGGFTPPFAENQAIVHHQVWSYEPQKDKWIATEHPFPSDENGASLSGGVGAQLDGRFAVLMGGVNKERFETALDRIDFLSKEKDEIQNPSILKLKKEQAEYLHHPIEWYKFTDLLYLYDLHEKQWVISDKFPQVALAGATLVSDENGFYLINGEVKPGIRTNAIWKLKVELKQKKNT